MEKIRNIFTKQINLKENNVAREIAIWIAISMGITIFIEFLDKANIFELIYVILNCPKEFLIEFLIILTITGIGMIFKKRYTVFTIIGIVISIIGIIDYLCIKYRGTKLNFYDIYSIKEAFNVVNQYMSLPLILISIAILSMIIFLICYLAFKEKVKEVKYRKVRIIILIALIFLCNEVIRISVKADEIGEVYPTIWQNTIGNMEYYQKSAIDIDDDLINETYTEVNSKIKESTCNIKPNIIILQLESFFDLTTLENVNINKDIIQNYRKIKEESEYGIVDVPTFGAGTIRSEFEMLTGYNLDMLPDGILPHMTFLYKNSIESMAGLLKKEGYDTTLIHNNDRNFFRRDECYENLQFDEFIGLEDMGDVETKYDWAVDRSNFKYVRECLEKENSQFIYNVTVESHGSYKNYNSEDTSYVTGVEDAEALDALCVYIDKIQGTDEYLGEVYDYVNELEEPTVLIIFADHLPNLDVINSTNYWNKSLYKTEYVIWNNMGKSFCSSEMELYLLGGKILDTLQINKGFMWTFHDYKDEFPDYLQRLKMIEWTNVNNWDH